MSELIEAKTNIYFKVVNISEQQFMGITSINSESLENNKAFKIEDLIQQVQQSFNGSRSLTIFKKFINNIEGINHEASHCNKYTYANC